MNKHLLTVIASAALATASVQADTYPVFFSSRFDTAGPVPAEWKTYGGGRALNAKLQPMWPEMVPYMIMDLEDNGMFAYSTSYYETTPAAACADWLVTPPVKIESDAAILSFTARSGNYDLMELNKSSFKVRMSENGQEQASFPKSTIGSFSIKDQERRIHMAIKNVKDKNVCFAFINDSEMPSVLGFNDVKVSAYLCEVVNHTPIRDMEAEVSLTATMMTPVPCTSFTAVLETENGIKETLVIDKVIRGEEGNETAFGIQLGNAASDYEIVFENKLSCPADMPELKYTVTITPDYEGAPSTVIDGVLSRTVFYTGKVIVEEATGTWCGFCPRGAVALDFFSNNPAYGERFLGIAVHGGSGAVRDPMEIAGGSYLENLGIGYYPGARVNRYGTVYFNGSRDLMTFFYDEYSYTDIEITDVKYNETTNEVEVTADSRLGFNHESLPMNMAVVVIEDKLSGSGSTWNQQNNFSGESDYNLLFNYSEDWLEYWHKYTFAPNPIKAKDMEYNHVARGIYPAFDGEAIGSVWECDEPLTKTIKFTLPDNIKDIKNVTLAALLIDGKEGYVYSFSRTNVWGEHVGVNNVEADNSGIDTWTAGSLFNVRAAAGTEVRAFSADGRMIGSWRMNGDVLTIPTSLHSGLVILNIAGADGAKTVKTIW